MIDRIEERYQQQKKELDSLSTQANVSDDFAEMVYAMALGFWRSGNLEKAANMYSFLFMLRPHNHRYLEAMGRCQYDLGNYQRALVLYSHAGLCGGDSMKAMVRVALCHLMSGDKKTACFLLDQVIHTAEVDSSMVSSSVLARAKAFSLLLNKEHTDERVKEEVS